MSKEGVRALADCGVKLLDCSAGDSREYDPQNDNLPYGHGEKSVYIASGYMRLTRDEAFAIRYHMGFSGPEDPGNVGKALEMFPLAWALCVADMEAAYFMEGSPQK